MIRTSLLLGLFNSSFFNGLKKNEERGTRARFPANPDILEMGWQGCFYRPKKTVSIGSFSRYSEAKQV